MVARGARTALLIGMIGAALSGCATTHANTAPDAPPLDMPLPPPRAVEAADVEPPPPIALPEEPGRRTPPSNTRRTPTPSPRPDATKTDPSKPDVPAASPAPVEAPKPAEEPPKPPAPPTLQTAPAGREGEEEQRIRAQLQRATTDLNRIDYRALNEDARTQYNTAKRFVTQAEEALHAKNLVFARSVADKAAALAAQLAGK